MKTRILIVCIGLLLTFPFQSFAWGLLGHRVIGGIADLHLGQKARIEIKKLLGNESLAMASNWADFIKSDRSYDYLSTWHYINIPAGMDEPVLLKYLQRDTAVDLYTKMNFIISELKSRKSQKSKQAFYLKLLVHFVGDAHQPMHTGRPEDRAGNNVKVYWFNRPTNLHRVWDEHLVEFQQLSYTEHIAAINFTTPSQRDKWQRQPVSQWILESYQAAQHLYNAVKPEDKLSYRYNYDNVDLMNAQLLKAGIRLAGLLNDIYGK